MASFGVCFTYELPTAQTDSKLQVVMLFFLSVHKELHSKEPELFEAQIEALYIFSKSEAGEPSDLLVRQKFEGTSPARITCRFLEPETLIMLLWSWRGESVLNKLSAFVTVKLQ